MTRMEFGRFEIASTICFADRDPLAMRLGSGARYKRPFPLVVTITGATDRGSSNLFLPTRTVLECIFVVT